VELLEQLAVAFVLPYEVILDVGRVFLLGGRGATQGGRLCLRLELSDPPIVVFIVEPAHAAKSQQMHNGCSWRAPWSPADLQVSVLQGVFEASNLLQRSKM